MPMINWCYFSKKEIERDDAFFRSQELSSKQTKEVRDYLYKRLSTTANKAVLLGALVAVFAILLSDFLWKDDDLALRAKQLGVDSHHERVN